MPSTPNDVSVINSTVYVADKNNDSVYVIRHLDDKFQKIGDITITKPISLAVSVNKTNNTLYILHLDDQDNPILSILNVFVGMQPGKMNHAFVKNVSVDFGAEDVRYNPEVNKIYVTNSGSESVSIVNPSENYNVTDLVVGMDPKDLTFDENTNDVFVLNRLSKSISVIDGQKDYVKNTLYVEGSPLSLEYDEKQKLLYYTTEQKPKFHSINLELSNKTKEIPVGRGPSAMSYDDNNHRIFVINSADDSVSVINTKNNSDLNNVMSFKVGNYGEGATDIAYDKKEKQILVAYSAANYVSVVDDTTFKESKKINTNMTASAIFVDDNTGLIYVTHQENNSVSVIKGNYSSSIPDNPSHRSEYFRNPSDITVDPKANLVFVANYDNSSVSVLDAANNYTLKRKSL